VLRQGISVWRTVGTTTCVADQTQFTAVEIKGMSAVCELGIVEEIGQLLGDAD
jgi:hypothetical protein